MRETVFFFINKSRFQSKPQLSSNQWDIDRQPLIRITDQRFEGYHRYHFEN